MSTSMRWPGPPTRRPTSLSGSGPASPEQRAMEHVTITHLIAVAIGPLMLFATTALAADPPVTPKKPRAVPASVQPPRLADGAVPDLDRVAESGLEGFWLS